MDFDSTVDRHLAAVRDRDLAAFASTLHDDVAVLLPTRTLVRGRLAVGELHREWFADPDWTISFTPQLRTVVGDTGCVLLDVHYTDVDPDGAPVERDYVLGLTFAREDAQWRLILDQNSVFSP